MLRLRVVLLFPIVAIQCSNGSPTPSSDSGVQDDGAKAMLDSGVDATKKIDASADVAVDSPIIQDDASTDAASDSSEDAPSDASAETSDGGFVLTSVSGLVLWLDANQGVTTSGSNITAWSDQSGQSNDATGATSTPTLVSSSINSLPAAHFVSSSAQSITIADATSLQWGTGDYYIAVVAKFDNDPSHDITTDGVGSFYTKIGSTSGVVFFANNYDIVMSTASAGLSNIESTVTTLGYDASYNDGTARLYAVQRASGSEYLRVDGSQVASGTSSVDVDESGIDVSIGLTLTSLAALDGDIAEIVAVKGTLSSSDLSSIESYLQTKYGL